MITCLKTELHKSGYVGFKFWQVDRVAGTARIFLADASPHLPKRGRVRLHVGYPFIRGTHNTRGTKKVVQRIRKTKRTKLILQPSPSWEVIWRRHGTLIGRNKSACRCDDTTRTLHTAVTHGNRHTPRVHLSFSFSARYGHVIKILQSAYGNQSTSFERSCTHGWRMVSKEGESTPSSFVYSKGIHTFLERKARKNTWPFMRLTEVKERARVSEEQKKNSIIGERCTWRKGSGVKTRCKF